MSAISETHKERDGRSVLHAAVNPDTLLFTYAKDKHVLSFVVENTGDATQIFKIKTTASYLYRIRPVYFKLPVQERQEVNITYKGTDAGPIPMSGKDRITIVFAHALDAKKPTTELWEMHRPYANLSYAESREYVRVQFVDANGKLVVSDKRSQSGAAPPRSITMRPEPPVVAPQGKRTSGEKETDEKSNKSSDPSDYRNLELQNLFADIEEADPPSQVATAQLRSGTPRSGTPKTARTQQSRLSRSPSPNSLLQQRDNNNNRKSPAQRGRSRDPIESILTSASKDAKAIVYVQYGKGGRSRNDDEGSTYEDEESRAKDEDSKVNDESTKRKKKAKEEDTRKRDDDTRREELLRKKNEETRKREDEERRKDDEEKKKKEDAEADEKSREAAKHTSNEEVQKQEDEENRPVIVTPRRRKLGPDGKYIDDISVSHKQIIREKLSVRLVKKGPTKPPTSDGSYEDDKPPQPKSDEY